jgi:hypothetical protein
VNTTLRSDELEGGLDTAEERRAEIVRLSRKLQNHSPRVRERAVEQLVEFGLEAVPALREALFLRDPESQIAAARGLGRLRSRGAVQALIGTLASGNASVRAAAAHALGEIGDREAVAPLHALLRDTDLSTRAEAATALGNLGREESIPALMDAYRVCFLGRSARKQRWIGALVAGALLGMLGLMIWGTFAAKVGGFFGFTNVFSQVPAIYIRARRAQSKVACAITEALVRIAERNPRPEMHQLVPELRAVAGDRVQHEPATRDASRRAADRIEALTAAVHNLPVAAATPRMDPSTLPQPAEAPHATTLAQQSGEVEVRGPETGSSLAQSIRP